MKKFIAPILVIIGFFALIYAILASTDRTAQIALFGAGYSALLVAIYTFIPAMNSEWPESASNFNRNITCTTS